jgi:hypothetical protein
MEFMMKKIFVLVCVVLFFTGCDDYKKNTERKKAYISNKYDAKPYGSVDGNLLYLGTIDNHEYLFVIGCRGSVGISHKADCKFCKENK